MDRFGFCSPDSLPSLPSTAGSVNGKVGHRQVPPLPLQEPPPQSQVPQFEHEAQRQREMQAVHESLRVLVFGVGSGGGGHDVQDTMSEQGRGSMEELKVFYVKWTEIVELRQSRGGGGVHLLDVGDYFGRSKGDRFWAGKLSRHLKHRYMQPASNDEDDDGAEEECPFSSDVLPRRRSLDTSEVQDLLLRLLWPRCTDDDLAWMHCVFDVYKLESMAEAPLPVLPAKRRHVLLNSFKGLDRSGENLPPYEALVEAELVNEEICMFLQEQYDKDGSGTFTFEVFLEILCPYGFRAHEGVTKAVTDEGVRLKWVTCPCGELVFTGWLSDDTVAALSQEFNFVH